MSLLELVFQSVNQDVHLSRSTYKTYDLKGGSNYDLDILATRLVFVKRDLFEKANCVSKSWPPDLYVLERDPCSQIVALRFVCLFLERDCDIESHFYVGLTFS